MRPPPDDALIQRWVATWRTAGPALEADRRAELERLSTPHALAELAAAFEHALRHSSPSDSSGLLEQQRYFARVAR